MKVAILRAYRAHIAGQRIGQGLPRKTAICRVLMEPRQQSLHGHSHLFGIKDRLQDLFLKARGPSIPALRLPYSPPQNRGPRPLAELAQHADTQPPRLRKSMSRIMTAPPGYPSFF